MPRDYKVYVDSEIIWDIIQNKLPGLGEHIQAMVEA